MNNEENNLNQNNVTQSAQPMNNPQNYSQSINSQINPAPTQFSNGVNQVNIQQQTVIDPQPAQVYPQPSQTPIANMAVNNNPQMEEKPKKKKTGIIIGIILVLIVVILAVIIIPKISNGNGDNNDKSLNSFDYNKSNKKINYLNEKKGDNRKLAMPLKNGERIEYVLTIDNDEKIELSKDYLEDIYNDDINITIDDDYNIELIIGDADIEIKDTDPEDEPVIKQKDNWYLTNYYEDHTRIYYKLEKTKEYYQPWLSIEIYDDNYETIDETYFDKFTEKCNVYTANYESGKVKYVDSNNNPVNLDDYIFVYDDIASSLTKYKLYLTNPIDIEFVDSFNISYSYNDELFFIYLEDEEEYHDEIKLDTKVKEFTYNGLTYEMYVSDNYTHVSFYRKEKDKYLELSFIPDNGTEDTEALQKLLIEALL